MPIVCPLTIPRLTTEELAELDYEVMAQAFATHAALGRLADEAVYQADFAARLEGAKLRAQPEIPITVSFRGFTKVYSLDLVVAGKAIYELKTVSKLAAEHEGQLINYLLLLGASRGKLLNFRPPSIESRFINAPVEIKDRYSFRVKTADWAGDHTVRDGIIEMLRDWGAGLELPLYHQGIVHLLGGEEAVTRQLPMHRDGVALGTQRFHLMESDAAFRVTALSGDSGPHRNQLRRLLSHSPLRAIHWINITRREVRFVTVT
jgi:GxxExxY protein